MDDQDADLYWLRSCEPTCAANLAFTRLWEAQQAPERLREALEAAHQELFDAWVDLTA